MAPLPLLQLLPVLVLTLLLVLLLWLLIRLPVLLLLPVLLKRRHDLALLAALQAAAQLASSPGVHSGQWPAHPRPWPLQTAAAPQT
jgi:hypothetical protein